MVEVVDLMFAMVVCCGLRLVMGFKGGVAIAMTSLYFMGLFFFVVFFFFFFFVVVFLVDMILLW